MMLSSTDPAFDVLGGAEGLARREGLGSWVYVFIYEVFVRTLRT